MDTVMCLPSSSRQLGSCQDKDPSGQKLILITCVENLKISGFDLLSVIILNIKLDKESRLELQKSTSNSKEATTLPNAKSWIKTRVSLRIQSFDGWQNPNNQLHM